MNKNYARSLKFIFSKKATKFDEIFTVDLTFTTLRQINSEDFINFCGLLREHEFDLFQAKTLKLLILRRHFNFRPILRKCTKSLSINFTL